MALAKRVLSAPPRPPSRLPLPSRRSRATLRAPHSAPPPPLPAAELRVPGPYRRQAFAHTPLLSRRGRHMVLPPLSRTSSSSSVISSISSQSASLTKVSRAAALSQLWGVRLPQTIQNCHFTGVTCSWGSQGGCCRGYSRKSRGKKCPWGRGARAGAWGACCGQLCGQVPRALTRTGGEARDGRVTKGAGRRAGRDGTSAVGVSRVSLSSPFNCSVRGFS